MVVEVVLVLVDGLVVAVEVAVPLVLFVVAFFSAVLVAAAEEVEVLGRDLQVADSVPIPGIHTIMQLFSPLVVALVVIVLPTVAAVALAVVDQVDLLVAVVLDLINGMVVEAEEEETPTIDLT